MARYSFAQLAGFARQAGFNPSQANLMAAIAMAESGGNDRAYNGNARTGDKSYGLWQINMLGAMGPQRRRQFGISSDNALFDPVVNARAAYAIYRQQGLRAWSVYKSGSYKKFLGGAGAASQSVRGMERGSTGGFVRPVQGGRQSQAYGVRNARYSAKQHTGVDYAAPTGTPVYATSAGRVVRVTSGGAYGRRIEIEHGGKVYSLYAHLSAQLVKAGQTVTAGQLIGKVGSTGNSTGPHLHFEIRKGANAYRNAVDPMQYLNGRTTPEAYVNTPGGGQDETVIEDLPLAEMLIDQKPMPGNVMQAMMVYSSPTDYTSSTGSDDWRTAGALDQPDQQAFVGA